VRRYFDRALAESLAGPFNEWPIILCPVCRAASLEPTIDKFEDIDTLNMMTVDDPEFEFTSFGGFFHGVISCPRSPCGNKSVVAGRWELDPSPLPPDDSMKSYDSEAYINYYITYIFPTLRLMEYPIGVPDKIKDPVAAAELVLLSDASAAANRIRIAIEALLDCQGVRKCPPGKRSRLTTDARIGQFRQKNSAAASFLMAVKWIGNAGSHDREIVPLESVLEGFELFARAVELIYDPHEKALERRAAIINQQGRNLRFPKAAKRVSAK
jgi:hypothetical protein